MLRKTLVLLTALGAASCATHSKETAPPPVVEAPRNPIDLRRTTLVVRDVETSLAFYRDALGMTVEYDQTLTSPGLTTRAKSDGVNRSRLVLLKANDDYIGMLGLWQFLDQTKFDRRDPDAADFTPGEIVLVFNAANQEDVFARAAAVKGVRVVSAPGLRKYPSPAGDIEVLVSMLVDPDGHTVELNKVIRDPRRK